MITLIDRAMLLFYYCVPKEHSPFDLNEEQYSRAVVRLIDAGLLSNTDALQVTDAGKAMCEALRDVPLPVQKWIIPSDRLSLVRNEGR